MLYIDKGMINNSIIPEFSSIFLVMVLQTINPNKTGYSIKPFLVNNEGISVNIWIVAIEYSRLLTNI